MFGPSALKPIGRRLQNGRCHRLYRPAVTRITLSGQFRTIQIAPSARFAKAIAAAIELGQTNREHRGNEFHAGVSAAMIKISSGAPRGLSSHPRLEERGKTRARKQRAKRSRRPIAPSNSAGTTSPKNTKPNGRPPIHSRPSPWDWHSRR